MENFGQESNWFNNEPSPIQTDVSINYGNQERWFTEPSPIQFCGETPNRSYIIFNYGEPNSADFYIDNIKIASMTAS